MSSSWWVVHARGPCEGLGRVLSTEKSLPGLVLWEEQSLSPDSTQRLSVDTAFPSQAKKVTGTEAKLTAHCFISCCLITMCIVMREQAEGMERDVTTVQDRNNACCQPGHHHETQPPQVLPAVGHWYSPVTPFPTSAFPIPGSPSAFIPSPTRQSAQMSVDTLDAEGEKRVMPSSVPWVWVSGELGERIAAATTPKGGSMLRSPAAFPALDPAE